MYGDIIEMCKFFHNKYDSVTTNNYLVNSQADTNNHELKNQSHMFVAMHMMKH